MIYVTLEREIVPRVFWTSILSKKLNGSSKFKDLFWNGKVEKLVFFYRKWVEHVNSPVVFCHNDLQGGNILLRHDLGDSGKY